MNQIYLDYAAATPVHPTVLAAMQSYLVDDFYNPSAAYSSAIAVRQDLESARSDVAQVLGVHARTIVFTAGATESIHLAVHGVLKKHPGANVAISAVEHEAVQQAAETFDHRVIPVDSAAMVSVQSVLDSIDDSTVLVSVMYANNEVGTVQPLADIAKALQTVRDQRKTNGNMLPLYFHTDASQAGAYLHLNVQRLGIDLMTLNGGKMYGPKQSGILYVSPDIELAPWLTGGGQERGLRAGTENVALAVGFAAALQRVQQTRKEEGRRVAALRDELQAKLLALFSDAQINGHQKRRLPNSLNLTIPGIDGERAVMALDEAGLSLATGSACSASSDEPSHVLAAMGCSEAEANSSLRISLGEPTAQQDIDETIKRFRSVLGK